MYRKISLLVALIIMITGCFSSTSAIFGKKKPPKWVNSRPIDNSYYIGIGMAKKSTDGDYIQIAKNNALNDMTSEISVVITGTSVLHQFEDNSGYKEKFEAYTNTFIKDELEGFEIVDSWGNKEEYWVYYHLSKETYKKIKRDKLNKAKDLAKDFYEKAREYENENDLNNALLSYVKSFDAIKKHLDDDISIFTLEGRINLGSAIYKNIQDIFSALQLKPRKLLYKKMALIAEDEEPVQVKAQYAPSDKVALVKNLPLILYFPDNKDKIAENVITDDAGYAICNIASKAPKGKSQKINIILNMDAIFGEESNDNFLRNMFDNKGAIPQGEIVMEISELYAFLEVEEIIFGENSDRQVIKNIFKEQLSESFFSFTQDKDMANVIVRIHSSVVKGDVKQKYNLYSVFLDCSISIEDTKTGLEIFNEGFENMKGMKAGSYESALQDAHKKAENKIKKEILTEIAKISL